MVNLVHIIDNGIYMSSLYTQANLKKLRLFITFVDRSKTVICTDRPRCCVDITDIYRLQRYTYIWLIMAQIIIIHLPEVLIEAIIRSKKCNLLFLMGAKTGMCL